MKKLFLLSIAASVVAATVFAWRATRPLAEASLASYSQIFIHGTPVCIMKHGDAIVAEVGRCEIGAGEERPDEALPPEAPFHGRPGMSLPPGHPPIPPDGELEMRQGGSNRVAI